MEKQITKERVIEIKKRAEKVRDTWDYPNEYYLEAIGGIMVCDELLKLTDSEPVSPDKDKPIQRNKCNHEFKYGFDDCIKCGTARPINSQQSPKSPDKDKIDNEALTTDERIIHSLGKEQFNDKAIIQKQEELIESQKEIIKFWNNWSQFLRNEDFDILKKLKIKFYQLEQELSALRNK